MQNFCYYLTFNTTCFYQESQNAVLDNNRNLF